MNHNPYNLQVNTWCYFDNKYVVYIHSFTPDKMFAVVKNAIESNNSFEVMTSRLKPLSTYCQHKNAFSAKLHNKRILIGKNEENSVIIDFTTASKIKGKRAEQYTTHKGIGQHTRIQLSFESVVALVNILNIYLHQHHEITTFNSKEYDNT